ncbi:SDR family NAD(P)-dependent oxidoreductase [Spongiibacter thalassae]|nr:SDR family NAD(P)-dependent oxidoreductase [Spongiibacter thalassae]
MFDLTGKVALITGGNSGIGMGMAEGLLQQGCEVAIWGTNAAKNDAALEKLSAYGPKVTARVCDVTDAAAVESAFAQAVKDHGRIDGCFANAGYGLQKTRFDEFPDEEWHRVLDINLNGAFYVFRCAAKHMRERALAGDPFGRLVGTSSLAAVAGQPRGQHYAASKGGLNAMIRSLAVEYAKHGVTAHSIMPGFVESALTKENYDPQAFTEKVMPRIPARRMGQGSDFAAIAAYIMSDASSWHTGQDFVIDGGYWIF